MRKIIQDENGNYTYIEVADEPIAVNKDESRINEIADLKAQLAESDYKAIKFAEGWLTADEYEPIKAQRQNLRDRINKLESEVGDDEE